LLELRLGIGIVRFVGVFIVDLPAEHVGIVPKTHGHLRRHFPRQFAILGAGETELLAVAVLGGRRFRRRAKSPDISASAMPAARCGGAENGVDSVLRGRRHGAITQSRS
jgi:hypothetical protein